MNREMVIQPLTNEFESQVFDLVIVALGYEERSSFIARRIDATRKVAIAFPYNRVLAYESNASVLADKGYSVVEIDDSEVERRVFGLLSLVERPMHRPMSIALDISSMTRQRIASIAMAFSEFARVCAIDVEFLYSVAEYSEPVPGGLTTDAGPVIPKLAGWSVAPEMPVSLILGIGYELDWGLGAKEFLDPADWWLFMPKSINEEYARAMRDANAELLDITPSEDATFEYEITRPFDTFIVLEALVARLALHRRVVLLPFGPKIFALLCTIIGLRRSDVSVWRISEGRHAEPVNRNSTGTVTGLSVSWADEVHDLPVVEELTRV